MTAHATPKSHVGRSSWYFRRELKPIFRHNVQRGADSDSISLPDGVIPIQGSSSQLEVTPTAERSFAAQAHDAHEVTVVTMPVGFESPDVTQSITATPTIDVEPIADTIAATKKTKDSSTKNNTHKDSETTSKNTATTSKQGSAVISSANPSAMLISTVLPKSFSENLLGGSDSRRQVQ